MSERTKQYFNNPEARQRQSEKRKKYYENNPDAAKQQGERKKKYYEEHPEIIKKRLDTLGQNKPFDIFTKNGTYINTFNYIFEANNYLQKEYNITSIINIGQVLAGKIKTSYGFVFKYK